MVRSARLRIALLFVLAPILTASAQFAQHVDPFLGADGGGNTFPGPSLPFGMIKPGPDMQAASDWNAGWAPAGNILGFSQTHVSGTGGGAKYGNVLVQPTIGKPSNKDYGSPRDSEKATAGYYQVTLKRYSIDVEVTAAQRAALYRFTYPKAQQANILFDMGHCLVSSRRSGEGQVLTASSITVRSSTEISGSTSVTNGWNKQPTSYTVFFYAVLDTPAESWGTWKGAEMHSGSKHDVASGSTGSGAWMSFPTTSGQKVTMKLGISFISEDQARQNALDEIPAFDFEATHAAAVAAWDKALGNLQVDGATPEQAQMLYTALYHTMLMPVDRTGENPLWKSTEPYYDDYYAIWDTFRTSSPLLTLIAPQQQIQIVRALVDLYRHESWLPDARSGNYNGRTQGGSNAEFVITDAFLKGLPGIDWKTALAAEVKDAEVSPRNQVKEGRGGLEDWHRLGYLTEEGVDRSGSKQMEYAANDFEIALLAKGLNEQAAYTKYLQRSGNWENLWDPTFEDEGFRGFIRPRHRDGSWLTPFTAIEGCSWGGKTFYEGNSWTYSTFVPQNVARLIEKSGGSDQFVKRLDAFFTLPGRYDVGNEPGFLSPYLYLWANRHDKTAEHVHSIIAASYHTGRSGLPGNDDSGAMSSWYVFGQIGIFPNAGQDVYLIGSPSLPKTTLHLADGKTFVIEAQDVSPINIYVTAAELNGKPLDQDWFRHADLIGGGSLVLHMAAKPGTWPSGNPPPSTPAMASH